MAVSGACGARDLLLAPVCLLCRSPCRTTVLGFCPSCDATLSPRALDICLGCGAWLGENIGNRERCHHCSGALPFAWTVALGNYKKPGRLRNAVLNMKRPGGWSLAQPLGMRLARAVRVRDHGADIDVVVPAPIHRRMRVIRGYNQAAALAEVVAAELWVPFRLALRRPRIRDMQSALSRSARHAAVKGTITPRVFARIRGKRVLLVDDVLTTGATLGECAAVLRRCGAREVAVAVLARALG